MSRPTKLTIFQDNLQTNLEVLKNFSNQAKIWACVKAGGYGHGIDCVAKGFSAADGLAILEIGEAYEARRAGWRKPILLLEGVFEMQELDEVVRLDLEMVIHSEQQLSWCLDYPGLFSGIWIKINSGMNRLGFTCENKRNVFQSKLTKKIFQLRKKISGNDEIRWLTHFSVGENEKVCSVQEENFLRMIMDLGYRERELLSFSNSSAIVCNPKFSKHWVRPGILIYGASPTKSLSPKVKTFLERLSICQSLTTRIVSIQHVRAGGYVGYGRSFRALNDMRIGVAAVGYADGYPRSASEKTVVLVEGVRCNLVGVVSMDLITIDLSNAPNANIGSNVECWGKNLSIMELAETSNRLCYELFTGVTARVRRSLC